MRRQIKILHLLIPVLLLVGCTHMDILTLRPDYKCLTKENSVAKVQPPLRFVKGTFVDKRSNIMLFGSFNQGVHTFNLKTEQPIDEILFESVKTMLVNSGQQWTETDPKDIRVNIQLLNTYARRTTGLFDVFASSSIEIKLDFVNATSGDTVYSNVYIGRDERSQAMAGTIQGLVKESINASIINMVNQVGGDEQLANALKKVKPNP